MRALASSGTYHALFRKRNGSQVAAHGEASVSYSYAQRTCLKIGAARVGVLDRGDVTAVVEALEEEMPLPVKAERRREEFQL